MDYWLVACIAAFLLGVSKGGMPVVGVLSVPVAALVIDPILAAGLLLPVYLLGDWYAIYLFRGAYSSQLLRILIPSAVIGVLSGYFAVSYIPSDFIKLLLAVIGISYLVSAQMRRMQRGTVAAKPVRVLPGVFWGALAGLTSYISHAGGPPYQAYVLPQRPSKLVYLGTTAIFFSTVNLMKLPAFILAGQITQDTLRDSLWLAPVALLGAWSGAQISRRLSEPVFFMLIELALGVISVKLLLEVLVF